MRIETVAPQVRVLLIEFILQSAAQTVFSKQAGQIFYR